MFNYKITEYLTTETYLELHLSMDWVLVRPSTDLGPVRHLRNPTCSDPFISMVC